MLSFVPVLSKSGTGVFEASPILAFSAFVPFGAKGAILTALLASSITQARFLISGIISLEKWRFVLVNMTIITLPTVAAALIFHIGSGWPEFPLKLPLIGFGMCAAAMAVLFPYHLLPLTMERKYSFKQAVPEAREHAFSEGTLFAYLGGFLAGFVLHYQPLALPAVVLLFVLERWLDWALYVGGPNEFYKQAEAVSQILESRDEYTERHSEEVSEVAYDIAVRMDMGLWHAEKVRQAGRLHDLGKILTPDDILLKPGPLTPEERETMKLHASQLREVLGNPRFLQTELSWAECHHEKWDGTGYPKGLKGEEIPPEARILAVADVWNALTTKRIYRKDEEQPSPARALAIIKKDSGAHFDPKILNDSIMEYLCERAARLDEEAEAKAAKEAGQQGVASGSPGHPPPAPPIKGGWKEEIPPSLPPQGGEMGAAGAEAAGTS